MATSGFGLVSWVWAVVAAPFIGSFLGVLALRLPAGMPVALTRSACPHCATPLGVLDLVPVVSWLASRGRCRHCAASLGLFYPGIELAAVAIALWAAVVLPGDLVWAGCVLGWTLLAAAVIDWQHTVLPDVLVLPLIPVGIGVHAFLFPDRWPDHVLGAAAGFVTFAAIGLVYRWLRKRDGLGLGDAKLLAASGAWVAWIGLPSVVLLAALVALAGALIWRLSGRVVHGGTEIPFGPALALATWVVWLYGPVVPF